jgi:hypothetical protein
MSRRQFVILSREPATEGGEMPPLGTRADVVAGLAHCNTSPEVAGGDTLYGPGLEFELPPDHDPVRQMLLNISDDDIAWIMIMRIAREFGWKILDPQSGREFQA